MELGDTVRVDGTDLKGFIKDVLLNFPKGIADHPQISDADYKKNNLYLLGHYNRRTNNIELALYKMKELKRCKVLLTEKVK